MSIEFAGPGPGEARRQTDFLISQVQEAHDLAHNRGISSSILRSRRVSAVESVLEAQQRHLLDERVHVTLAFPRREEDAELNSQNYLIYVSFTGSSDKPNFINVTRTMLMTQSGSVRVDNLASHVEDFRAETSWERQKRLVTEIVKADVQEFPQDEEWKRKK